LCFDYYINFDINSCKAANSETLNAEIPAFKQDLNPL
jgi:hypothetical protein